MELLADYLLEVEWALADYLPVERELHLPVHRKALPHPSLRDKLEADSLVAARRRTDAEHRMPRAEILSEPVVSRIVVEDTLKVRR
jgi:hypothetical protein